MYLRGVGLGAYYFKNGQPATVLYVGDTMSFNVPGYSQVWLDQYQNGALQYSGPMSLPMPPYTLQARDAGSFTASVYKLSPAGKKSDSIGSDQIQVLTQPAAQPTAQVLYAPPTINATQAPTYANPTGGGSGGGTQLLPTGVATPSAPAPATVLFAPTGPAPNWSDVPQETQQTPATQEAGFSPLGMALILGVAAFAFATRGK